VYAVKVEYGAAVNLHLALCLLPMVIKHFIWAYVINMHINLHADFLWIIVYMQITTNMG
jgi:hypothetical protein